MTAKIDAPRTLEEYLLLPYTISLIPEPGGAGFAGSVEELPGCVSQGETWSEVGHMVRDAMSAWISSALDDGAVVPVPREEGEPAKILLRLPHTLHHELRRAAAREGVSLNQYVLYLLATRLGLRVSAGDESR
jgi:antitoxin HicB